MWKGVQGVVKAAGNRQDLWFGGIMGNKLFTQVTAMTGLPEELIGPELKTLLERKGVEPEQMTMESLREALADYLNQMAEEFANGELFEELPETSPASLRNRLS